VIVIKRLLLLFATVLLLTACGQSEEEKQAEVEAQEQVEKEAQLKKEEKVAQKEQEKKDKESAEQKKKDKAAKEKEEQKESTIKVDEEIELRNLNFKIQTVTIENDKVTVPMSWNHWASNEKIHLTALAYPVVKQGDDELEMIGGEDSLLRQTAKGVDSRIEVEYQLIDDETPITITMKTTSDDPEEGSITVDIK